MLTRLRRSELVRESAIETYLRDQVKAKGGRAYKWVSPGNIGVPDRLIVFPGGTIYFRELKAPGKKPTPLQAKQLEKLQVMGFDVGVIDSKDKVDDFIREAMDR